MGGGGVMRAAAKVAGVGVVNAGIRGGLPVAPPAEQSVCKASRPFAAMVSSSNKGDVSASAITGVERNSWEMIDDWEFEHEFGGPLDSGVAPEPLPRVVFGGAPSLEEAKTATTELKDAIEKVYLSSSTSTVSEGSIGVDKTCGLAILNNESLETKTLFISQEPAVVPKNAMRAFNLLSESPAAQSVVASIAADPNVWHAVLQNEALMDFFQTHKNCNSAPCFAMNPESEESVADSDIPDVNSPKKFNEFADAKPRENSGNGLMDILENVRLTVVDMVRNVGDFFQNIFGFSAGANGNSNSNFMDKTLGASFMALAVMVIMVVMMKRV